MKSEKWSKIGEITEKWVSESYPTAKAQDVWKVKDRLNAWFEFLNVTDTEFVENYKRTSDKVEWARRIGNKVIAFYNDLIKRGYAVNTARSYASTPRAFCRDNCVSLIIPRKKISKPKSATGEHEFALGELQRMFHIADVRDKAILSTAISLGFSVEDFANLPRELIESLVNKAIAEKIDFIGFDYERKKTGVVSRSHLTPEARDCLKAWFEYIDKKRGAKSEWVWCNGNGGSLTDQALNDVIKSLVQKANITTTGKIRFHLLRKFLMNALHDAGFTDWEVKRAIGKEIPTTDSTYLQGLSRKLSEKFQDVYPYIKLTGYMNKNGLRVDELEEANRKLQEKIIDQDMRIEALLTRLEELDPKIREKYNKTLEVLRTHAQQEKEKLEEFKSHE
jgi:site-specific recombinase XerD